MERGEKLLSQIQQALHDIAQSQLESQALEEELRSSVSLAESETTTTETDISNPT